MSNRSLALLAAAACVLARTAAAQTCNMNPSGPDQLTMVVPQFGTDFDIGWQNEFHDFQVPGGGRLELCLNNCDTTTDPICDVQGYAAGQSAAGRGFWTPIPVVVGSVAACIVTTLQAPFATGTANIQTGDVAIVAAFSADFYLTSASAVCPVCSGPDAGNIGTCSGGATPGAACTTGQVITVQGATGGNLYRVSRDCLPSGTPLSTAFSVNVTTGTNQQSGLCPGQTTANDCGAGTCTNTCSGAGNGGIRQICCSDDSTKSCFADPLVRTGLTTTPFTPWPHPLYPKTGPEVIVGTFCAPAVPGVLGPVVNSAVGLPGPGAFVLPTDAEWSLDPTPVSTTTTTTTPVTTTTTTLPGCTTSADCADADACTDDVCTGGTCSNPPIAGAPGVACRLGTVDVSGLCGVDPIDSRLQTALTNAFGKAKTALQQIASAPAKRVKKLRKAADTQLKTVAGKVKKAGKKKTITPACGALITQTITDFRQAIAGL